MQTTNEELIANSKKLLEKIQLARTLVRQVNQTKEEEGDAEQTQV